MKVLNLFLVFVGVQSVLFGQGIEYERARLSDAFAALATANALVSQKNLNSASAQAKAVAPTLRDIGRELQVYPQYKKEARAVLEAARSLNQQSFRLGQSILVAMDHCAAPLTRLIDDTSSSTERARGHLKVSRRLNDALLLDSALASIQASRRAISNSPNSAQAFQLIELALAIVSNPEMPIWEKLRGGSEYIEAAYLALR